MRKLIPITNFRKEEIKSLKRKFLEEKIGNLIIHWNLRKSKEYVYSAKLKQDPKFIITASSKDHYHAKDKLITKLRKYLREHGTKKMFPCIIEMRKTLDVKTVCY